MADGVANGLLELRARQTTFVLTNDDEHFGITLADGRSNFFTMPCGTHEKDPDGKLRGLFLAAAPTLPKFYRRC